MKELTEVHTLQLTFVAKGVSDEFAEEVERLGADAVCPGGEP